MIIFVTRQRLQDVSLQRLPADAAVKDVATWFEAARRHAVCDLIPVGAQMVSVTGIQHIIVTYSIWVHFCCDTFQETFEWAWMGHRWYQNQIHVKWRWYTANDPAVATVIDVHRLKGPIASTFHQPMCSNQDACFGIMFMAINLSKWLISDLY